VYQKVLLLCILASIVAVAGRVIALDHPEWQSVYRLLGPSFFGIGLEFVVISLIAGIFALLLAMKVYSTPVGIALGILVFAPYVGLLALLIINGEATSVLQRNGFRVGLLGAKLSQFRDRDKGE
jgi:hypothetical protein